MKVIRLVLFVILIGFPLIAVAQRERPTGQSVITGRVVFADTGRPVRRAAVNLYTNLNHPAVRTTPANHRGEFRFTEVPAGSYFVVAHWHGVVSPLSSFALSEFGFVSNNNEAEHTRVTVDGKNTSRCELRVIRGGTIKGTVTYVDKEPVINARIVLFRRKGATIMPFFIDPAYTNDRGMYRIDGLPEGEFFVGIETGSGATKRLDFLGPKPGLPTSFYPGASSLAEAKAIQLQPGAEVIGINMTVDVDLRRISGVLKWRNSGALITKGVVALRRKNDPTVDISLSAMMRAITPPDRDNDDFMERDMMLTIMSLPPTAEIDEQTGKWQFENLSSGTYTVSAYAALPKKSSEKVVGDRASPDEGWTEELFVTRRVEITVTDEDRNDVTIEMSEGGRILGSVTMADGSPAPRIPITLNQENSSEFLLAVPQYSKSDGTFLLEAVSAGEVRLDVEFSAKTDLYLKSITLGGQDVTREPIRVNEGAEVAGVRITLEAGLATLSGRVQLKQDGSPAGGAGVLLVKADPKLWQLRSSRCFANSDAVGAFKMTCPPGDYLVFTWPAGSPPVEAVGEFIRAQAAGARTVSLQSKQEKQIEVTVAKPKQ